jgi:PAS domain S-box-containing protein
LNSPLNILLVEDNEDDAELIALELKRSAMTVEIRRADSRAALSDALASRSFDVVLCDYNLPQLTGEEALLIIRNLAGPDVPVIFVSGGIGEETAVDLMRCGAQDYVLKDNLARLPVAIEREVAAARVRAEKRRTDVNLDAERRLLHQVMESIPDAICFKDRDRRYLGLNRAECRVLGAREESEVLGTTADAFLGSDKARMWREEDEMVLLNGEPVMDAIERIDHADGEVRWFSVSKAPLRDRTGAITGLVGISRDITERKHTEQIKDEFIATVSHELRTPLTSIAGSLSLLAAGAAGQLPEPVARLIKIAHSNCERLVRLVNDILDIERLDGNGSAAVSCRLDLREVAAKAIEAIEGFADKHGVRLKLEECDVEANVFADPDLLMQIVTNLLSNAVKFSPKDTDVVLSIEAREEVVSLTVRDHGPGIPESFRSRIFGKFAQVDATDSRKKGGTGLGLHIVKRIVDQLTGSVSFVAAPGGGTIFHVLLPRIPASPVQDRGLRGEAAIARMQA